MSQLWQKFVRTFGDNYEIAGVAFLIAVGGVITSVALFVHWLAVGRYAAAFCLAAALGIVTGVFVRDYRRGQWSILSGTLIVVWIILTIGAAALAIWLEYEKR